MKKIIYLIIAFILGIFIGYMSYNTNRYEYLLGKVENAINEGKYDEVARVFGGYSDTNAVASVKNEKVDLVVFNGTNIVDVSYGEERWYAYEETYYIYLFNLNYEYGTYDGTDNKSALIFEGNNSETYVYPFVVNSNTNSEYLETDSTKFDKEAALLKSTRDLTSSVGIWDFIYININKSMVEFIADDLDGIKGFTLVDNKGNEVIKVDVNMDFTQPFYNYMSEMLVKYNEWLKAYSKDENSDEAQKIFYEYFNPWSEKFEAEKAQTGFIEPYDTNILMTSEVIWKTIGDLAVYASVILLFYVFFFHFSFVSGLLSRIFKTNKKSKKGPVHVKKNENYSKTVEVLEESIEIEKEPSQEIIEEEKEKSAE